MPITIFRVSNDHKWIFKEITNGRLRQGWGAPEFNLVRNAEPVPRKEWENTYFNIWNEKPSPLRYTILSRMPNNLGESHVVVIPNIPEYRWFTIAKVNGGYKFDKTGEHLPRENLNDFRHVVYIDPNSVRYFHNHANEYAYHISGLFKSARSAVNCPIYDDKCEQAANKLLTIESGGEPHYGPSEHLQFAIEFEYQKAAKRLLKKVASWSGDRFETAVCTAFKDQGFTVQQDHRRYDGQGADCDLLINLAASQNDLFLSESREVAVQVKCKTSIDKNDVQSVKQIVQWSKLYGNETMRKCVLSSADDFTSEAKELAEGYGVVMICGLQTMCFLLGRPEMYREDWDDGN